MPRRDAEIDPARLAERLAALPGIERVREAAAGISAYLVGGAVRDLLLDRDRADVDVAVEGGGVSELARRLGGAIRAHERFATAAVRVDGLEDLRRRQLRVLHDGSFADDPTRALRAARYAARYGFALERRTAELLRRADLSTVSTERMEAELRRLASEPEARRGFELVGEWGLVELAPEAPQLVNALAELLT